MSELANVPTSDLHDELSRRGTPHLLHLRTQALQRVTQEKDLLRAQVVLMQQERDWVIDKLADHAGVTDVRYGHPERAPVTCHHCHPRGPDGRLIPRDPHPPTQENPA